MASSSSDGPGHDSEDPARPTLRSLLDPVVTVDQDRTTRFVNPAATKLLQGADEQALLDRHLHTILPEDVPSDALDEALQEALDTHTKIEQELHLEPQDAWLEASIHPRTDGATILFREITQRKRDERTLRQSEDRFRTMTENVGEVVWMSTDDPTEILYANPTFEHVWGQPRERLYEDPSAFFQGIHPADRAQVREAYAALPETPLDETFRVTAPDGRTRWIQASTTTIQDDGQTHRIVGIAEDVTEHVLFEETLTDLHGCLHELLSARSIEQIGHTLTTAATEALDAPLAIAYAWDEDDRMLHPIAQRDSRNEPTPTPRSIPADASNPIGRAFLETDTQRFEGTHPWDQILEPSTPKPEGGMIVPIDEQGLLALAPAQEGALHGRRDRLVEILAASGQAALERAAYERGLRRERKRLASLIEQVEEYAIFMLDPEGYVESWNAGAEAIKGYAEDEIIGQHVSTFYTDEARRQGIPLRNLRLAAAQGSAQDQGWRVRKDGSRFWAHVTITAIRDEDDHLEGFAKVTRDMTERQDRERRIERERERFQSLIREVEEYAIFMLDPEGYVESWNAGAKRIKGYTEQEIIGEHFSRFYTDEDRQAGIPERNLELALEHGSVQDEGWRVRKDGSRFWANVTITAIRGEDGDVRGFSKVTRDMTDRREREKRLEEEIERFELLVDEIEDYAIFMLDPEGRVQSWNRGAESIKGYSEEEILGEHFSRFYRPEDQEAGIPERNLLNAAEHGSVEDEGWRVRKDGSRFWANVTITAIRDDEGELRGFAKVTRDMTERHRREQELETSRRALVENFPNGAVALVDEDLRYRMVGGTPPEGIDVPIEEIQGRSVADVLPPAYSREIVPRYQEAFEGDSSTFEIEHDEHTYRFHIRPIFDDQGNVFAAMGISQDISELKQREQQLAASNARLEQFAYAASHDLQEPLRMVTTYLQLIEDRYGDLLDEEGHEFFHHAVDGAKRMREMVQSLLEFSSVTSIGRPLEPTDAGAVLETVLSDLEVRIEETDAEITQDPLPEVLADPVQLGQVFRNLLANALQYSGEETPRVHVSAKRVEDEWVFSVQDEGIGIEPEHTERIFEVFRRLQGPGEARGAGVGLAICQQIVGRHGGHMWVESEPGEGSVFYFSMPAVPSGA